MCEKCREKYKTLSSLYSEMQKMNELENKAESGTHLCIDVEDAVSTLLLNDTYFVVLLNMPSVLSFVEVYWNMQKPSLTRNN